MPDPNSNIPGVSAHLQDGGLEIQQHVTGPVVCVVGATTSASITLEEPILITRREDLNDWYDADGTPSEIVIAAQEVFDGGAQNVELYALSDGSGTLYNGTELDEDPVLRHELIKRAHTLLMNHRRADGFVYAGDAYIDSSGLHTDENFGYTIAKFCHERSKSEKMTWASIGVTAPTAAVKGTDGDPGTATPTLSDMSTWVTNLQNFDTSTTQGAGFLEGDGVTDNGGDGVPDNYALWYTSDGLIPTGSPPRANGTVQKDDKQNHIDIGKYLSVCATWARFPNLVAKKIRPSTNYYNRNIAAAYAGLIASLPPHEGTTNKLLPGAVSLKELSAAQVNTLVGKRYVVANQKTGRLTIARGVTFAHNVSTTSRSDYVNLTTLRITAACVEAVRLVSDPFIGRPSNGVNRQALRSKIDEALGRLREVGMIEDYRFDLNQSATAKILGQLKVDLTIQPAFEILEIQVRVGLEAESTA